MQKERYKKKKLTYTRNDNKATKQAKKERKKKKKKPEKENEEEMGKEEMKKAEEEEEGDDLKRGRKGKVEYRGSSWWETGQLFYCFSEVIMHLGRWLINSPMWYVVDTYG